MSQEQEIQEARCALEGVPGIGAVGEVSRLGGLTNLVYRVESEAGPLCLRVPGKGTEEYIDREVEAVNARAAAKAGVSPEVLHFGADGLMVTRFLDGTVTMDPAAFKSRRRALAWSCGR